MSAAAIPPSQSELVNRRLAVGLSLSLLAHAVLLSLQFGVSGLAPGAVTRLIVRLAAPPRVERDVAAIPASAPADPPAEAPPAAQDAPAAATHGLQLVDRIAPPPPPPPPAPARHAARKRISRPDAQHRPEALSERVIAQESKPEPSFVVPQPEPEAGTSSDPAVLRTGSEDGAGASAAGDDAEQRERVEQAAAEQRLAQARRQADEEAARQAEEQARQMEMARQESEAAARDEQQRLADQALALRQEQEQQARQREAELRAAQEAQRQEQMRLAEKERAAQQELERRERSQQAAQELARQQQRERDAAEVLARQQEQQRMADAAGRELARQRAEQEQARLLAEQRAVQERIERQRQAEEQARLAREREEALVRQRQAEELAARQRAEEEARVKAELRQRELAAAQQKAQEEALRRQAEDAARRQAEQLAQRQAEELARQRAQAQVRPTQDVLPGPDKVAAGAGAGAALDGNGLGTGAGRLPRAALGSELGTRARELVRGLGVLGGAPPVARASEDDQRQRRRVVSLGAERDVPLRLYIDGFRQKIERNGTLNGGQLGNQVRIDPVVSVALRSDGTVEDVMIVRSSGHAGVDAAVRRIVRLNERYAAFPPNVAAQYDVIEIRRIWTFANGLKLLEEVR